MPYRSAILLSIGLGFLTPGCRGDRAATRMVNILQFQNPKAYLGPFQIDVSQLPSDAIESRTERGGLGSAVTNLAIRPDYPVKIVLVPVTLPETKGQDK